MKRIVIVQKVAKKCNGPLTPTATTIFESIKKEASKLTVLWNGGNKYQCNGLLNDPCVVDMAEKECACRKWTLTGFPCKHVVAAIWDMSINGIQVGIPEDWVL